MGLKCGNFKEKIASVKRVCGWGPPNLNIFTLISFVFCKMVKPRIFMPIKNYSGRSKAFLLYEARRPWLHFLLGFLLRMPPPRPFLLIQNQPTPQNLPIFLFQCGFVLRSPPCRPPRRIQVQTLYFGLGFFGGGATGTQAECALKSKNQVGIEKRNR